MAARGRWFELLAGAGLTLLGVATIAAPPASNDQTADAKLFEDQFRPLLAHHCVDCHSGDKPKGNLPLDILSPDFADPAVRAHWTTVVKRLQAG
jgi:hypothetical protein